MNVLEFIFIVQFLAAIGITLAKLYNIFSKGEYYGRAMSWVLFIAFGMAWGVGLFIVMLDWSTALYGVLFRLESMLLMLQVVFILFELFYDWGAAVARPFRTK